MRKAIIALMVAAILALPFLVPKFGRTDALTVQTVQVRDGSVERVVLASARLEFRRRAEIKSEIVGQIKRLQADEGDVVDRGDLLIQLDSKDASLGLEVEQAKLRQRELEMSQQKVVLEQRQRDYERARRLFGEGVINTKEFEEAKSALKEQERRHEVARQIAEVQQAQVRGARREVRKHAIESPLDGTIIEVNVAVGEVVSGAQVYGNLNPSIVVADPSSVFARAYVAESNRTDIELGQRVELYPATHDEGVVLGTIRSISLVAQEVEGRNGRYFPVEITVDPSEETQLHEGVSARVEIVVESATSPTVVPVQSVRTGGGGSGQQESVFVYDNGKAKRKVVTSGVRDDRSWAIQAGLEPGSEVIVGPHRTLSQLVDGAEVTRAGE